MKSEKVEKLITWSNEENWQYAKKLIGVLRDVDRIWNDVSIFVHDFKMQLKLFNAVSLRDTWTILSHWAIELLNYCRCWARVLIEVVVVMLEMLYQRSDTIIKWERNCCNIVLLYWEHNCIVELLSYCDRIRLDVYQLDIPLESL